MDDFKGSSLTGTSDQSISNSLAALWEKSVQAFGEKPACKTNIHKVIGGQLSIRAWDPECKGKGTQRGREVSLGDGGDGVSRNVHGEYGLGLGSGEWKQFLFKVKEGGGRKNYRGYTTRDGGRAETKPYGGLGTG